MLSNLAPWSLGRLLLAAIALTSLLFACHGNAELTVAVEPQDASVVDLPVFSPGFKDGEAIPSKFTCDGDDVSPALRWGEPPDGTTSFVVIVDDPDAPRGVFTHWVVFDVPGAARFLTEAQPSTTEIEHGARQGRNDAGTSRYLGPCPPHGEPHQYRFYVYALDNSPELEVDSTLSNVLSRMRGHVLALGLLEGHYARR